MTLQLRWLGEAPAAAVGWRVTCTAHIPHTQLALVVSTVDTDADIGEHSDDDDSSESKSESSSDGDEHAQQGDEVVEEDVKQAYIPPSAAHTVTPHKPLSNIKR